ncbi:MAG: hypothetical protein CMI18_01835 [Opitutaceae bacterium]|nr:hypothetical protein [Opitutaceae bacterium]
MKVKCYKFSILICCIASLEDAAEPALIINLSEVNPATNVLTRAYGCGEQGEGTSGVPVTGRFDCNGDSHLDCAFAQMRGDLFGRTGAESDPYFWEWDNWRYT